MLGFSSTLAKLWASSGASSAARANFDISSLRCGAQSLSTILNSAGLMLLNDEPGRLHPGRPLPCDPLAAAPAQHANHSIRAVEITSSS